MINLKLTQFGNSTGVVIPKEVLERMRVGKGDTIHLTETPDGYRITPYDQAFAEQMAAFGKVAKQYRNALRELAK